MTPLHRPTRGAFPQSPPPSPPASRRPATTASDGQQLDELQRAQSIEASDGDAALAGLARLGPDWWRGQACVLDERQTNQQRAEIVNDAVERVQICNFRDVGGFRVEFVQKSSGAIVSGYMRPGLLFRSSAVERASQRDAQLLVNKLKIRSIVDIRTPDLAGKCGPYLEPLFSVHPHGDLAPPPDSPRAAAPPPPPPPPPAAAVVAVVPPSDAPPRSPRSNLPPVPIERTDDRFHVTTLRLPISTSSDTVERTASATSSATAATATATSTASTSNSDTSDAAAAAAAEEDARFWAALLAEFPKYDVQHLGSDSADTFALPVGDVPLIRARQRERERDRDRDRLRERHQLQSLGPEEIKRVQGTIRRTRHGLVDVRAPLPSFELDLATTSSSSSSASSSLGSSLSPSSSSSSSSSSSPSSSRSTKSKRRQNKHAELILSVDMTLLEESMPSSWGDESPREQDRRTAAAHGHGHCYRFSLVGRDFRNALISAAPRRAMGIAAVYYMTGQGADKYRGAIVGRALGPNSGLEGLYQLFVESCQSELCQLLRALASSVELPVVVVAQHGKDRVGLLCALVQYVCGVPLAQICENYALSEEMLEPLMSQTHEEIRRAGFDPYIFSRSPAKVMRATFDYVAKQFGSVEAYLDHIGFDSQQRAMLRRRLVELAPPPSPTVCLPDKLLVEVTACQLLEGRATAGAYRLVVEALDLDDDAAASVDVAFSVDGDGRAPTALAQFQLSQCHSTVLCRPFALPTEFSWRLSLTSSARSRLHVSLSRRTASIQ